MVNCYLPPNKLSNCAYVASIFINVQGIIKTINYSYRKVVYLHPKNEGQFVPPFRDILLLQVSSVV